MLPCQGTCPHYQSGCHKSCEAWRQLQERQRVQRQQKKAYLDYYNDLCLTMTRQFRALSPCRFFGWTQKRGLRAGAGRL